MTITKLSTFYSFSDTNTPYTKKLEPAYDIPGQYWSKWVYSSPTLQSPITRDKCNKACQDDAGCKAAIFVNDQCHLADPNDDTNVLVSSTDNADVWMQKSGKSYSYKIFRAKDTENTNIVLANNKANQ